MRRKARSTSTGQIVRTDRGGPPADGSRMQGELHGGERGARRPYLQVTDDFPAFVPVTQRELDVLETYLGSLLDDMLKRTH